MNIISFEKLYNTEFLISEVMAKPQFWSARGNIYNALGRPKISHTLLWFKNCRATITDSAGKKLEVEQNQLAYMSKGLEYVVKFYDTNPDREDTVVVHFQMSDRYGNDIAAATSPIVCIENVDSSLALALDVLVEEYKKNIVCMPVLHSELYKILAAICKKQKKHIAKDKYACIRTGIELLEQNSDLSISEIAAKSGVSECYFRRLFQKYSGESPISFRQRFRIERAKQLLLSDEQYTVSEIAQELGFSDIYHFSKTFKKYCGASPSKYMQGLSQHITAKHSD
ncbi:MAG: helix-turn-helix transcriptional regulator [Clostridia bacterium]|nr:helix-turn-helix transcriptional regulator [Clostridia bacterium]